MTVQLRTTLYILFAALLFTLLPACEESTTTPTRPHDLNSPQDSDHDLLADGCWWAVDQYQIDPSGSRLPRSRFERILPGESVLKFSYYNADTLVYGTLFSQDGDPLDMRRVHVNDGYFYTWSTHPEYWAIPPLDSMEIRFHEGGFRLGTDALSQPGTEWTVYEHHPEDELFPPGITESARVFIESHWSHAVADSLIWLNALASDSSNANNIAAPYPGTREQWDALAYHERVPYLTGAFWFTTTYYDGVYDNDPELVVNAPDYVGIGWDDWEIDRSIEERYALITANNNLWPGGSEHYDTLLDMLDVRWTYPE